ncbi:immunoglobulin-like and fibronectin type III domain-containing protein 1 [Phycodurus eques]|uniref:immunoglobulin-like and fibronectin type III domain-containing protein 1 n=1 Tax=Phycodurus eques TaxID=693459 RepID=UPI002ACDD2ED|nr:immunoglobulin-like and fibronectin type III domain-containing protein 1 [Phycodurus eques]
MSADKKDYERICMEYGITNFRGMLKKLKKMKQEQGDDITEDSEMVTYSKEECNEIQHSLKQVGKKHDAELYSMDVDGATVDLKAPDVDFAIKIQEVMAEERQDAVFTCVLTGPLDEIKWFCKNMQLSNGEKFEITVSEDKLIHKLMVRDCLPLDAGIYVAVAGIRSCNAWLVVEAPDVDFAIKIQEVTAEERQDAVFTCVLTGPLDEIKWFCKNMQLSNGEKFEITVSEDKLIHKLMVRDCLPLDAGIYAAVAGIRSCNAWLVVEADKEGSSKGNKAARKNTMVVGGDDEDLLRIAKEQQERYQKEMEEKLAQSERDAAEEAARLEAQAAKKRSDEAKAASKAAARAKKAEAGVEEPSIKAAGSGSDVTVEPHLVEQSEDNEVGENSLFMESVEVDEVTGGDGAPVQDIVKGNDHGEGTAKPKSEKSGKKEKLPKVIVSQITDGEDAAVGNDHGEETAEQNSEKSVTNCPKEKIVDGKDAVVDPGVHFHIGLSDCKAIIGEDAELVCKLSSEDCEGIWYKDGEEIKSTEAMTIIKEGSYHKLKLHKVPEEFAGKYKFEADGRKTEALVVVEDPPRFNREDLKTFINPVTVKKGHKATFRLAYMGQEPIKVQWFLEGEELSDAANIKLETSDGCTRLLLMKLQRKDSGEVKLKLKNEFATAEALTELIVLDKPTPPMGPVEIVEASSSAIEIKWRPPKDSGGCNIGNYILERQQVGRNTWKKVGPIGPLAKYRDLDVDHGRRYCYRIRVETEIGTSELMETEDIQAGTKAYPGPPSTPKVVSAFKDCINLSWTPGNSGGTKILGYNLEKRKKGSNLWGQVNPPDEMIRAKGFAVKDVVEGMQYEFRVSAINNSGPGEFSTPSEFVFARDPKKPPGKVINLKVTDSSYTTLCLSWTKPKDIEKVQDEAKGYFVEIRPAENTEWNRCNSNLVTTNFYTVKNMKSLGMYWVRVIAINDGGEGEPQELDNYVLAMPPPVRPRFTDTKIKSFMVVRAGNSARLTMNFEASPWPEVTWLKDDVPVTKKVTISNAEGTSQLLIPSSERSDSGVYTVVVKNIVGQETFSIEIRVTDEPKPPGPVEIEENVPGTVTISWTPSPDEKRDDRLHYMVMKRDSTKGTWLTVADHIFNNKFTACNIMPGCEYQFRVYAKNDMGSSKPSESPKWLLSNKKEKFTVNIPESKTWDLQCPPKFLVPLKMHTAPQGYECYMSCALKGDPTPHVTWLRNNISLNTNTNYYISNTCGVCSLLILRVGPKDTGEYKVVAENPRGRAECSTKLTVRE